MSERQRHLNNGLRKVCGCARRVWAKCPHPWHFNFKPKGGPAYRFSVDAEAGRPISKKTEAALLAETWRAQIRAGTFRRAEPAAVADTTPGSLTLETFGGLYFQRLGRAPSANSQTCFRQWAATPVATGGTFGAQPLTAITEDAIEAFFGKLRQDGKAASTRNKYLTLVKAMFRWAVRKGYLTRNPAGESEQLKRDKHAQRHRRFQPGEEAKLLAHAGPHLQRLIIGALETGCRKGELLGLQWRDVALDRREMTIQAERAKTRTARVIPLSARLVAVLTMAQTDPTGADFGADAYVFGDAIGRRVGEVERAWETAVLKAHAHTPTWRRSHALSATSRAAFDAIDLTFHDLRHEAGSRLLEAGWPIHHVAHMLGHANISQTSTYLNATRIGLQDAMRRLDDFRCNLVGREAPIDKAPPCNDEQPNATQPLVN